MKRIIALDETGQFIRKTGISYIGGYIVNVESVETEEKNIKNLLVDICSEFNKTYLEKREYKVLYPKSLHCSDREATFFVEGNVSNTVIGKKEWIPYGVDKNEVNGDRYKFISFLKEKVVEYLKKNGYVVYAFLDPFLKEQIYTENADVKSNLMDLRQGANLYERMAILSVYNNIFYSLEEKADEYVLELATRTLNNSGGVWDELYEVYSNSKGEKSTITNTSTYKTALATMLYENRKNELYRDSKYRFNVKSINYNREDKEETPFQYVADIVCSYMLKRFQERFGIDGKTEINKITAEGLIHFFKDEDIQVRVYDECDECFREMIDAVQRADIVEYYAKCYDLEMSNAMYKVFYLNIWLPKLESYFQENLVKSETYRRNFMGKIPEYIAEMNGYMGIREKAYEKGLYIAEKMIPLVKELMDYRGRNSSLFEIYDIILRGYNHRGAIEKSKKYIEQCEIYKGYVGIETYIAHTLRTLGFYFNSLDYESALVAGLELDKAVIQLKSAYKAGYGTSSIISESIIDNGNEVSNFQFKLAGKLWSSVGQAYGFLKKYSSGRRYFEKALQEFDKNSDDYSITMSHYLQLLISGGKKEKYEDNANLYFGSKDLWTQWETAFASNNDFMLLIYVKAFNVFYAKDRSNIEILQDMISRIYIMENKHEHPWELIYKNLYECILKQKVDLKAEDYIELRNKALASVRNADVAIKMIQINAKMTFLVEEGKPVEDFFVIDCLDKEEILTCKLFCSNVEEMTFAELKTYMDEKIVYAYR